MELLGGLNKLTFIKAWWSGQTHDKHGSCYSIAHSEPGPMATECWPWIKSLPKMVFNFHSWIPVKGTECLSLLPQPWSSLHGSGDRPQTLCSLWDYIAAYWALHKDLDCFWEKTWIPPLRALIFPHYWNISSHSIFSMNNQLPPGKPPPDFLY